MRHFIRLAVLGAFLLALPACFDYEARMVLNEDGSGEVDFCLTVPSSYEGRAGMDWERPLLRRIMRPEPVLSGPLPIGNTLRFDEHASFKQLGELKLSKLAWSLTVVDTGVLGLTDYTYKLTTTVAGPDNIARVGDFPSGFKRVQRAPRPWREAGIVNQADARAVNLRASVMGSHAITITQIIPGRVLKADNIDLGGYQVEPRIDNNSVSWQIPLAELVRYDVRANLVFSCTFKGRYQPSRNLKTAWASQLYHPSLYP